jgi:hypothetical protein
VVGFIIRHPVIDLAALALAGSWYVMGWPGPVILVLAAAAVLAGWRWRWPRSFARFITGPARGKWRRWHYQRHSAALMTIGRIKGMPHTPGSSRTPLRHARRTRTIWQCWHVPALSGLLQPSPASPGSGCPQLHRPAATGPAVKIFHLHSNHCASRRTHDSRHTTLSLMEKAGVPIFIASKWAGHYDAAFTMKTYVHASDDNLKQGRQVVTKIRKIA